MDTAIAVRGRNALTIGTVRRGVSRLARAPVPPTPRVRLAIRWSWVDRPSPGVPTAADTGARAKRLTPRRNSIPQLAALEARAKRLAPHRRV